MTAIGKDPPALASGVDPAPALPIAEEPSKSERRVLEAPDHTDLGLERTAPRGPATRPRVPHPSEFASSSNAAGKLNRVEALHQEKLVGFRKGWRVRIDGAELAQALQTQCFPVRAEVHPHAEAFSALGAAAREACVVLTYGLIEPDQFYDEVRRRGEDSLYQTVRDPHTRANFLSAFVEAVAVFMKVEGSSGS
jgi:hypothetical protein